MFPLLLQVVPSFLNLMQHRETALRESLLQQLEALVRMIKEHIRPYLPHIFQMIKEVWPECLSPLLMLVEAIAEVRVCFLHHTRSLSLSIFLSPSLSLSPSLCLPLPLSASLSPFSPSCMCALTRMLSVACVLRGDNLLSTHDCGCRWQVLGEEFKTYLPDIIPHMASVFTVTSDGYQRPFVDAASSAGLSSGNPVPAPGVFPASLSYLKTYLTIQHDGQRATSPDGPSAVASADAPGCICVVRVVVVRWRWCCRHDRGCDRHGRCHAAGPPHAGCPRPAVDRLPVLGRPEHREDGGAAGHARHFETTRHRRAGPISPRCARGRCVLGNDLSVLS